MVFDTHWRAWASRLRARNPGTESAGSRYASTSWIDAVEIVYTHTAIRPTAGGNFRKWVARNIISSEETFAVVALLDDEL